MRRVLMAVGLTVACAVGMFMALVAVGASAGASSTSPQQAAQAALTAQEKQLTAAYTAVSNAAKVMTNSGGKKSLSNAETDITGAEANNLAASTAIGQIQTGTTTTVTPPATTTTGTTTTPAGATNCAGTAGSGVISQAALDSCGFPSMDSTGPPAGVSYTSYPNGLTISQPGTYSGLNVTGEVTVAASNVTITDSQITDADNSNPAVNVLNGVSGVTISDTSIHGTASSGSGALYAAVQNVYGDSLTGVVLDHVQFYNGDRILVGYGTVTNSYCGGGASFGSEHDECVYTSGALPGIDLEHDTLLNANPWQTAAVFVDSPTGCAGCTNGAGSITIKNSILGGGAYCIYGGDGNDGSVHTGPEVIEGNRFSTLWFSTCGQFGVAAYMPSDLQWTGNVWDNNNDPL